jgi:ribonuclease BN (tRNA processing enzyme)
VGLTLTVLGSCGSYPGPGGACSGYLVRGAGTTVWLDAGSGTLANLQRHVGLADVDAVVLSHEHPDHWSDVEGYWVACTYGEQRRTGVPVFSTAGVRNRVPKSTTPTFDWRVVGDGDEATVGGLRLRFSRTDHMVETVAVCIDGDGTSLVYSADTGAGWSPSVFGTAPDLFLCEATYTSDKTGVPGHLSAAQAGEMARAAGARRLVLTHFWPTVDRLRSATEAAATFGAPVAIAAADEEYRL